MISGSYSSAHLTHAGQAGSILAYLRDSTLPWDSPIAEDPKRRKTRRKRRQREKRTRGRRHGSPPGEKPIVS